MAVSQKGIPESLVRAEISLYGGVGTKVKFETHLSDTFERNVGVYQGSVLSVLLFAIVIDVVTTEKKEGTLREISW